MAWKTGPYFLSVLGAPGPRLRCWQAWFAVRPLLGLRVVAFMLCPHTAFPVCVCLPGVSVSSFFFLKGRQSDGIRPHPEDLLWTSLPKFLKAWSPDSHILKYRGLGLQREFWGTPFSPSQAGWASPRTVPPQPPRFRHHSPWSTALCFFCPSTYLGGSPSYVQGV